MKTFCLNLTMVVASLGCWASPSRADWTYLGDCNKPAETDGNTITFHCTNATVRLTMCMDDTVRVQMSPTGKFKPNEPWVVIKYDWDPVKFTVTDAGDVVRIETSRMTILARKSPFQLQMADSDGAIVNEDHPEGGMGFDGEKVICRKKLTDTDHFFGLGQRYDKCDLRGEKQEMWLTENETPVPFFMGTDGYGVFFHNTSKSVFDFTKSPYTFSAPRGDELDYYFIYGPGFKHILDRYTTITGKSPLPPKWAFGLHHSSWGKEGFSAWLDQRGQEGILSDLKAARQRGFPMDSIRVHARGCTQNYWASPATAWPESMKGWGSFSDVGKMFKEMHAANCHIIMWALPGILPKCKMYQDGADNGYYIMKDGEVWQGFFGSGCYGAIVDFCNPDARKWWGQFHHFLVDLGSDGIANDNGENMQWEEGPSMYSPYSGMTGLEYHNIYGMTYNMAAWETYRQRNPNKRCVGWARSVGAGTQRYPLQGTQDSHEVLKRIHGEIQGCINFGLSGVPFRIFTDNVTRDHNREDPLARLAQWLCIGVAGERSAAFESGFKEVDENYYRYGHLRYQLMPYIYTYVYRTTQTGVPLLRALVLEYQQDPNTYPVYCEYLLGDKLLIAPLWEDTTVKRDVYLPAGDWIDFWDDTVYRGPKTISYDAPPDKVPILVKAGAIIPMAPGGQRYMDEITSPYTIHAYPKGVSTFQLYEDDGVSYDYEKGVHALTTFTCRETPQGIVVQKDAPKGPYKIPERDHVFAVHKKMSVSSVTSGDATLAKFDSKDKLDAAQEGWFCDNQKNITWAKVKGGANTPITLTFKK